MKHRKPIGAVALLVALLTACGDDGSTGSESTDSNGGTGAAFPVTVEHSFGTTTIESEPQRVVSAGLHEPDFLYALGVAPVGVHEWFGEYDYATGPWANGAREALGATPAVQAGWDINIEWVAAQHPDVIVATYHDLDQATYDALSQIAPVVASPADYEVWTAPWQVELRLLGDALGRREQAETVISSIESKVAEIAAAYPEFAGAAINTVNFYDGQFETYSSDEALNVVLSTLGFVVPPAFDDIADGIYVTLSMEQIELLDELDVALWFSGNQAELEQVELYKATSLYTEGRSIWLPDLLISALAFNTPLSIEYYVTQLAPLLAAALDGDPATE